jgi:hypothetical protein
MTVRTFDPYELVNQWQQFSEDYLSTDVVKSNRFRRLARQMRAMIDDGLTIRPPKVINLVQLREEPKPEPEPARRSRRKITSEP